VRLDFVGPGIAVLKRADDEPRIESPVRTRPRERHPPAAAVIDPEPLENTGPAGPLGNQLSDAHSRVKSHHDRDPPRQTVSISPLPCRRDSAWVFGPSPWNHPTRPLRLITALSPALHRSRRPTQPDAAARLRSALVMSVDQVILEPEQLVEGTNGADFLLPIE